MTKRGKEINHRDLFHSDSPVIDPVTGEPQHWLRHTVLYSFDPHDPDPDISRIDAFSLSSMTLYTGHVYQPWKLDVDGEDQFIDPATKKVVHIWPYIP